MAVINVIKNVKLDVVADSIHTFAMMLEVGLGEIRSLRHLANSFPKTDLGLAYKRIAEAAPDRGLSDAFADETAANKTIPRVVSELLAAGAATGKEADNLERAAEILERSSSGRAKMRSALISPIMSVGLIALLIIALAVFGVPFMHSYYEGLGLPDSVTSTIIMVVSYTLAVIIGLFLVALFGWWIFWMVRGRHNEIWHVRLNRFTFRIPVWGPAQKYLALNRFFDVLGPLLEAGIDEVSVLERSAEASGSPAMRRLVLDHVAHMRAGELTATGAPAEFGNFSDGVLFPTEIATMLTGAPAGKQQLKVLERLARNYREKAATSADRVVRELPAMVDGFLVFATIGLTALVGAMMLDMTIGLTQYGNNVTG